MKMNITVIMMAFCLLSSRTNAREPSAETKQPVTEKKILIVYLSRTNNTKAIAEIIQNNLGGDLVAIELEKPSPEDYKKNCRAGIKRK